VFIYFKMNFAEILCGIMSTMSKNKEIDIIENILRNSEYFMIEARGKDGEIKTLSKKDIEKMSKKDIEKFIRNFDSEDDVVKLLISLKRGSK